MDLLHLLSGAGRRVLAVIEVYIDESGTHAGAPLVTVAGYWGRSEAWAGFSKQWSGTLARAGLNYFHAKEPQSDSIREALADAIDASGARGLAVSMRPDDYAKWAGVRWLSAFGNLYAVSVFHCASRILEEVSQLDPGPVSFIVEHGQPNASFVARLLTFLMDDMFKDDEFGWNVASVTFARKSEFIPLQAADFLAHATSTNNGAWMSRLRRSGRVSDGPTIDEITLRTFALAIDRFAAQRRRERAARRRKKRIERTEE